MAVVREIPFVGRRAARPHTEINCECYVTVIKGEKFIQINSKGSKEREVLGATSQTLLFSENALKELQAIIDEYYKK